MDYTWHWYRVPQFLFSSDGVGPLIEELLVTLEISTLSLLPTLFLGLTTALLSRSHSFTARALARGYLELIRNTPLLIPDLSQTGFLMTVTRLLCLVCFKNGQR
jgi:polar amino acid transport system permease protein